VLIVEQPAPVLVSPKVHLQLTVPTPPADVTVNLVALLTSVGFGLATAVTFNLGLTATETTIDFAVTLVESVTDTIALNVPVEV